MPATETQFYFLPFIEQFVLCPPGTRVLEQGFYDPRAALLLAGRAEHVLALRPTVDLASELEQQAATSGCATLEVRLGATIEAAEQGTFDVAVLLAPYFLGNVPTFNAITTATAALKPEGVLYLQVHRRHGGETFLRHTGQFFEEVAMLGLGPGQRRLYRARGRREDVPVSLPEPAPQSVEFAARGVTLRLQLVAGVFAARAVDPGSRLLLDTLEVPPSSTVLDLGCGSGVLGLTLAQADPRAHVVLTDSSKAAVDLASANVALNGVTNVDVHLSDGYEAVARQRFDVIVSNLPAHRGHQQDTSVAERFIQEAPRHLTSEGSAWFVANKALPYELTASRAFRQVRIAAKDNRYKVLHCTGPQQARGSR